MKSPYRSLRRVGLSKVTESGDMTASNRDLVVVGGGAGGISAARAGLRRGLQTVLIQDGRVGGDCTFTGCVPSKVLIEAAAKGRPFKDALSQLHNVVEKIASTESAEALEREGIEVIEARAHFVSPLTLSACDHTIHARKIILATGSRPVIPPISGLAGIDYLTNENVFELSTLPDSIAVLGGGPIGCELAQMFRRMGTTVHLFESADRLLLREEPEVSEVIAGALIADGVFLHLGVSANAFVSSSDGLSVQTFTDEGSFVTEKLFVAVGRRPVVEGLDPAIGNVALDERGFIRTDQCLRTSASGVYAVGDVTGLLPFTHAADEMGRIAVRNAFSRYGRTRFDVSSIPWVTFTDPEVARVGLRESDAPQSGTRIAYLPMASVDRAVITGETDGFVKLIAGPKPLLRSLGGGKIIGATIVSSRAGEMIHEIVLAMRTKAFVGRLAQMVHAYPTWSTAIRQAAAQFFFEIDGRRARPKDTDSSR